MLKITTKHKHLEKEILPVQGPWLFLGLDCGGLGLREPLLHLRSLGSLSLGQEPGPTHFHGGNEKEYQQESSAPE